VVQFPDRCAVSWWRRRESNPRPKPPETGFYACSLRSVVGGRKARGPAQPDAYAVLVSCFNPPQGAWHQPVLGRSVRRATGRASGERWSAIKQPVRSYCCQLMALQIDDAAICVRDARPCSRLSLVETIFAPTTDLKALLHLVRTPGFPPTLHPKRNPFVD